MAHAQKNKKVGYKIVEGFDHYNNYPLYQVSDDGSNDEIEYVGEYHISKSDAEKELADLSMAKGGKLKSFFGKAKEVGGKAYEKGREVAHYTKEKAKEGMHNASKKNTMGVLNKVKQDRDVSNQDATNIEITEDLVQEHYQFEPTPFVPKKEMGGSMSSIGSGYSINKQDWSDDTKKIIESISEIRYDRLPPMEQRTMSQRAYEKILIDATKYAIKTLYAYHNVDIYNLQKATREAGGNYHKAFVELYGENLSYAEGGEVITDYEYFRGKDHDEFTNYIFDRISLDDRREIRKEWNEKERESRAKGERGVEWQQYLLDSVNKNKMAKGGRALQPYFDATAYEYRHNGMYGDSKKFATEMEAIDWGLKQFQSRKDDVQKVEIHRARPNSARGFNFDKVFHIDETYPLGRRVVSRMFDKGGTIFAKGKEGRYHILGVPKSEPNAKPSFHSSVHEHSEIKQAVARARKDLKDLTNKEYEIFVTDDKEDREIYNYSGKFAKGGKLSNMTDKELNVAIRQAKKDNDNSSFAELSGAKSKNVTLAKLRSLQEEKNRRKMAKGGKITSAPEYHEVRNTEYDKRVQKGEIEDTDDNFDEFDKMYFEELVKKGKIDTDNYFAKGGLINKEFLSNQTSDYTNRILQSIADYYGTTKSKIQRELYDDDAEMIYEYIGNDRGLRKLVYDQMESFKNRNNYAKGGNVGGKPQRTDLIGYYIDNHTIDREPPRVDTIECSVYVNHEHQLEAEINECLNNRGVYNSKIKGYKIVGKNPHNFSSKEVSKRPMFNKGGRVDEMVNSFNKYGYAKAHIHDDTEDFFERIGIDSDEIGTTSEYGTDIIFYDTKRKNKFNTSWDNYAKGGMTKSMQVEEVMQDHFDNGGSVGKNITYSATFDLMDADGNNIENPMPSLQFDVSSDVSYGDAKGIAQRTFEGGNFFEEGMKAVMTDFWMGEMDAEEEDRKRVEVQVEEEREEFVPRVERSGKWDSSYSVLCDELATYEQGGSMASGGELIVLNSSWFDTNKYDSSKMISALESIGAKNIYLEQDRGWSNQPEVVVFSGVSKSKAEDKLNEVFDTQWVSVGKKDWAKGGSMASGGYLEGKTYYIVNYYSSESDIRNSPLKNKSFDTKEDANTFLKAIEKKGGRGFVTDFRKPTQDEISKLDRDRDENYMMARGGSTNYTKSGHSVNGKVIVDKHPQGHFLIIDEYSYQIGENFKTEQDAYSYARNEGMRIKGDSYAKGGSIKGRNNKSGETFGVVIGSKEFTDDDKDRISLNVRSGYSSRISERKLVFDTNGNLIETLDYGYTLDGTNPDTNGGSGRHIGASNKKETIDAMVDLGYNKGFADKVIEFVKE